MAQRFTNPLINSPRQRKPIVSVPQTMSVSRSHAILVRLGLAVQNPDTIHKRKLQYSQPKSQSGRVEILTGHHMSNGSR